MYELPSHGAAAFLAALSAGLEAARQFACCFIFVCRRVVPARIEHAERRSIGDPPPPDPTRPSGRGAGRILGKTARSTLPNGPRGVLACVRQTHWTVAGLRLPFPGAASSMATGSGSDRGIDDEFTTRLKLTSARTGATISRTGHSVVYAGYAWRGRSKGTIAANAAPDDLGSEMREVLWVLARSVHGGRPLVLGRSIKSLAST